jgi:hypothetical protein
MSTVWPSWACVENSLKRYLDFENLEPRLTSFKLSLAHIQTSTEIDFKLRLSTAYLSIMGRLHSNGKGISASAIPYSRTPPAWLKTTPEQVVDQICKLAKKGATPSQIGVVLRDSHGIAQVKVVTGEMDRRCATRGQETELT